jgi:hypothetical protein
MTTKGCNQLTMPQRNLSLRSAIASALGVVVLGTSFFLTVGENKSRAEVILQSANNPQNFVTLNNAAAVKSVMHEMNGSLSIGNGAGRSGIIIASTQYNSASKSRAEMRIGDVTKGANVAFSFDAAIDESFSKRNGVIMQMIGPPFNQPSFVLRVSSGKYQFSHGPNEKTVSLAPAVPGEFHTWSFFIKNHGSNASFEVYMDGKFLYSSSGSTDNGQKKSVLRIGTYIGRDKKGNATSYIDNIRLGSGIKSAVATSK